MTRFARITGTGSSLPPRRLSNADMVDVWLRTTAGIPIEIRK